MVNDPDIDRVACTNANLHLNEHKEVPNEYSSFTCSSHSDGMFGKCDEFPMQKIVKARETTFDYLVREAEEAIQANVHPELIQNGSSGSYFVKNKAGKFIAVFKPKDEEPFAPLNPKWPKYFQRMLSFCCFGRACLIPNAGYLSEAAASLIDQRLQLGIVPMTRVVKLASPSFFYGSRPCCGTRDSRNLPKKEGSFQINKSIPTSVCTRLHHQEHGQAYGKLDDKPWEPALRCQLLNIVTPHLVHHICQEIKHMFRQDKSINRLLINNQLRVLRGQFWNLRMALEQDKSLLDLAAMEPLLVKRRYRRGCPKSDVWSDSFKTRSAYASMQRCCCF